MPWRYGGRGEALRDGRENAILLASVRDRRYEQLTAERVLRWGMQVSIHHDDVRATSDDPSVVLLRSKHFCTRTAHSRRNLRAMTVLIASFSAHLLMRRDMEIGSVEHIRYLRDVERELISNPGVLICDSGEMSAVM